MDIYLKQNNYINNKSKKLYSVLVKWFNLSVFWTELVCSVFFVYYTLKYYKYSSSKYHYRLVSVLGDLHIYIIDIWFYG